MDDERGLDLRDRCFFLDERRRDRGLDLRDFGFLLARFLRGLDFGFFLPALLDFERFPLNLYGLASIPLFSSASIYNN